MLVLLVPGVGMGATDVGAVEAVGISSRRFFTYLAWRGGK